jgi:hypothetical protein
VSENDTAAHASYGVVMARTKKEER